MFNVITNEARTKTTEQHNNSVFALRRINCIQCICPSCDDRNVIVFMLYSCFVYRINRFIVLLTSANVRLEARFLRYFLNKIYTQNTLSFALFLFSFNIFNNYNVTFN